MLGSARSEWYSVYGSLLEHAARYSLLEVLVGKLKALGSQWRPYLDRALAGLNELAVPSYAPAPGGQPELFLDQLARLLDLVANWNRRVDLTAARGPEELVDLYLADALVVSAHSSASPRADWVDIGTGGGAPGLVLQLARPGQTVTLVEPRSKRVAFLRTAIGTLNLERCSVVAGRSEELDAACCDVAVSRATFSPSEWLPEGQRLCRHSVWVLLARAEAPECPGMRIRQVVEYRWPLTGVERRAVEYAPSESLS